MKIYEAAKLIAEGKISPSELCEDVLCVINEKEKHIGAYITLCDNLREAAKNAEQNKVNSKMWGIPVAIKDNICTKGVRTTAASKMLEGFVPPYDATVTKRLKESGAIIIGKTNMDEFGMGSDGKYSAYGQVSNPVNYDFVPGGSSGGSAAAVSSGMALGALGTDTGGSIRQPAAFCGIYALKPTYSLVSRYGLIAFASSLDCIGPMCTSVKDLAIMTDVIAGFDKNDATSALREKENYYDNLNPCVKGLKIGLPKEFFEIAENDVKKAVLSAAEEYKKMGAVVEECSLKSVKYAVSAYYIISSSEASSNLARYDAVRFGHRAKEYENYEDMCTKSRSEGFGEEVKRRILLGTHVLTRENYDLYYVKANHARKMIERDFDEAFKKYDILLTPVSPVGVWKKGEKDKIDKVYGKDMCTAAVSLAKLPAVSVPCGSDERGMPVGMQLVGKKFSEQMLFNASYAYEKGGMSDV